LAEYKCLIIACPAWNIAELESDWKGFFSERDDIDFSCKKVAYLGTGDQEGYPDKFMDAMNGVLGWKYRRRGRWNR
jgi:flavodoxin I